LNTLVVKIIDFGSAAYLKEDSYKYDFEIALPDIPE
jgi:hypothetical protein